MGYEDIRHLRFGRLVAVERISVKTPQRKRYVWACKCDCGEWIEAPAASLKLGRYKSCGCLRREFAKRSKPLKENAKTRTQGYQNWLSMKARCLNPNAPHYERYGGRGITVCERWKTSFVDFLADMGPKPTAKHTLERIDNHGNYEPGNVRWATRKEQAQNRELTERRRVYLASPRAKRGPYKKRS